MQFEKEALELQKREATLYEEARKKKVNIEKLDKILDKCGKLAKWYGVSSVAGLFVTLGGAALTGICPIAGPVIFNFGLELLLSGGIFVTGTGVVAAGVKIKKQIDS